ncbi:MAG: hypothetical protein ACFFCZ_00230 [Promethearchaeota archaeon]
MKEAKYVEQVDLTELRKVFIENPEIIEQMKAAAEKEIQEGIDEGLYSPKLAKMLDSLHKKGSEEEEE